MRWTENILITDAKMVTISKISFFDLEDVIVSRLEEMNEKMYKNTAN